MIGIAISAEAFAATSATLPLGSVSYENKTNDRAASASWLEPRVGSRPPQVPTARPSRELFRCHHEAGGDRRILRAAGGGQSCGSGQTCLTFNVSALRITSSSNRVSAGPMISASIVSISLSTDGYSMGWKTRSE